MHRKLTVCVTRLPYLIMIFSTLNSSKLIAGVNGYDSLNPYQPRCTNDQSSHCRISGFDNALYILDYNAFCVALCYPYLSDRRRGDMVLTLLHRPTFIVLG